MHDFFPPTPQQQAVIDHRGGNLLVLAGPGTGKTETLARRFAALVAGGTPASRILVVTFSRRAAHEMRERVLKRLHQLHRAPLAVSELFVKTFHGFCARLLDGDDARLRERKLLTPVKERLLWRQVMASNTLQLASVGPGIKESSQFATDCLNVIGQLKGRGISAARFAELAGSDARLRDVADIFSLLEAERAAAGLHDYRDLVNEAAAALRDSASTASTWLRRAAFAHVLVDEFQDSDPMQLQLLKAVRAAIAPAPSFCFVGDRNQSIYRFRGATPDNVEKARKDFSCKTLELHDNRRSAQAILDAANADKALDPASKTQAADSSKVGVVRLVRPRSVEAEVRFLRDEIAARVAGGVPAREIAVLLRQTRPYQELVIAALREAGIPVAAAPAAGFHDDGLVDAVLTALRLLAAPHDVAGWARLLNNPIVGYRPIDVTFAFDFGRRNGISDPEAMLAANPPQGVRPDAVHIRTFLSGWRRCRGTYQGGRPPEIVKTIVEALDLLAPMREPARVLGFDAVASPARLQQLVQAALDYEEVAGGPQAARAEDFIRHLDETTGLLADANAPPPGASDGVRVISIHAAKGLEFDFVAIPQLLEGILPAGTRPNRLLPERALRILRNVGAELSVDDDAARREEHSLFYVALTRARTEVLATAAQVDDDGVDLQLSPFAAPLEKAEAAQAFAGLVASNGEANARLQAGPAAAAPDAIRLPLEVLSPTGIGDFVRCPRRFFYGNVLRLPRRDDDATRQGERLHTILRRFHETETDFEHVTDPPAAVRRCQEALRRIVAEECGFEGGQLGPLERFERDDLETRLEAYAVALAAEAAAKPFRVLACELPVASVIGDLSIRGKADRVDRLSSGGLVIRDYKSGRNHGPLADAVRRALDRLDGGVQLFGDMPRGLNLQTLLYIGGVEHAFGGHVERVEYIYFRGEGAGDRELSVDATRIVDSDFSAEDKGAVSRAQLERLRNDVALQIARLCRDGALTAFPTTVDEATCEFCDFVRICPGAGAIPL